MVYSEDILQIIQKAGLSILAQEEIKGREPCYQAVPDEINLQIREFLGQSFPQGLFCHQAEAIKDFLKGDDICLATMTASGKSLVFITLASHILLENKTHKVLAMYPARALIQDQLNKWREFGSNFQIKIEIIDGSIHVANRLSILDKADVVLMTPDVVHAWLMSNISEKEVRNSFTKLAIVILDEAHVYDGVFGTNMAYLLRRIGGIKKDFRLVVSTATLGSPANFLYQLTGRNLKIFSKDNDSSKISSKEIYLVSSEQKEMFENLVELVKELSKLKENLFIAFTDSRIMAEQLVSAMARETNETEEDNKDDIFANDKLNDARVVMSSIGMVLP